MQSTDAGFKLNREELDRLNNRDYEFEKETDALAQWLVDGNEMNDDIFEEVYQVDAQLYVRHYKRIKMLRLRLTMLNLMKF